MPMTWASPKTLPSRHACSDPALAGSGCVCHRNESRAGAETGSPRRGRVAGRERRIELSDAVPLLGDEAEVHRSATTP